MDLQKASMWKRMAAWILDAILACVIAVGFAVILSAILNYDAYFNAVEEGKNRYGEQYGVLGITQEAYNEMTEQEKADYEAACLAANQAIGADEELMKAYMMAMNLTLVIASISILLAVLTLEFVVPILLKNGQTVGKKAFSLGVIRQDGVRATTMQLFIRALLGKYTIETMIPVYIILMFFWSAMDITGTIVLIALAAGQLLCIGITRGNAAIHDKLAGTIVVDIASQKVFESTDELVAYTKRIHAERAQRQDY